jgi:hypothetical protein
VRKLLKWAIITFGIAALVRWWRSRGAGEDALDAAAPDVPAGDPADELRQKLAESRSEEGPAAETEASVDERRAEVHAEGRAAIDEMQSPEDDA